MFLLSMFMLLAPGLITLRILWNKNEIKREDYKFIACDYIIYSFLIHTAVYAVMFITYPARFVSFDPGIVTGSNIIHASFVLKYSIVSLIAAVSLPAFVPRLIRFWQGLEENRKKRITKKGEAEARPSNKNGG